MPAHRDLTKRSNKRPMASRRLAQSCTSTSVAVRKRAIVFWSFNFNTRSSVRRHGTYAAVSQPSRLSSNSFVRNTASSRVVFQTCLSHSAPSRSWLAAIDEVAHVLGCDPIVREFMKCPCDFQQPRILDRRVDAIEPRNEIADPHHGIQVRRDF